MKHQKGLHHISILAGDPRINAQFYVKKLGMRMVKKSVNQDDPSTYHLFYANEAATPGSSITFFPWPRAHKGTTGAGEAVNVAFKVPKGSEDFWVSQLGSNNISYSDFFELFGKKGLRFQDPDGLELDLIFDGDAKQKVSNFESTVPNEYSIQGLNATRLNLASEIDETVDIIEQVLGFKESNSHENKTLFTTEADIGGDLIVETTDQAKGRGGRGIVHHVAFRAANQNELAIMRQKVLSKGISVSEIIDRHWFKSVYFRVPSGVLFEIASDDPGYTVDEEFEHLGEQLILPPWLEPRRVVIENTLPNIDF